MLNVRRVSNDDHSLWCRACNMEPLIVDVSERPYGSVRKGKSYCLHVCCPACDALLAVKEEGEI